MLQVLWAFAECLLLLDQINESIDEKNAITIIVDVDDKNCLAELTVALKLNHGVRQWP